MKITVDIPDADLEDAIRLMCARTKKEAIVTAIREFNRRRRVAELVKHAGTCKQQIRAEELQSERSVASADLDVRNYVAAAARTSILNGVDSLPFGYTPSSGTSVEHAVNTITRSISQRSSM